MKYRLISSLLATTLSGCASSPNTHQQDNKIWVTSSPEKATVYASDTELGTTPLYLSTDTFPTRRVGIIFRPVGTLLVKKSGCQSYSEEVDDALLSGDIHVTLNCDIEPQAIDSQNKPTGEHKESALESQELKQGDSIEQQLRKLNSLHEKGLITEDEYQAIRKRILKQL